MWLSHARLVPVPAGQGSIHSTWSWSPAGPDRLESQGWRFSHPTHSWAQQGLKGGGVGGRIFQRAVGLALGSDLVRMGGGDPGGRGSDVAAKGRGSQWCMEPRGQRGKCGSGSGIWLGEAEWGR
jgi:hypothetical protein